MVILQSELDKNFHVINIEQPVSENARLRTQDFRLLHCLILCILPLDNKTLTLRDPSVQVA